MIPKTLSHLQLSTFALTCYLRCRSRPGEWICFVSSIRNNSWVRGSIALPKVSLMVQSPELVVALFLVAKHAPPNSSTRDSGGKINKIFRESRHPHLKCSSGKRRGTCEKRPKRAATTTRYLTADDGARSVDDKNSYQSCTIRSQCSWSRDQRLSSAAPFVYRHKRDTSITFG